MHVESYFPEGISIVQHDESQMADSVSKSFVEQGSPCSNLQMSQNEMKSCFLCFKNVDQQKGYVKPCECPKYAHRKCVIEKDTNFIGTKCHECGQNFKMNELNFERSAMKKQKNSSREIVGPVEFERCGPSKPKSVCLVCGKYEYLGAPSTLSSMKRIRPCFCGTPAHHGCMVKLLEKQRACQYCGVKYRSFEYGSLTDFFKRYAYQYIIILIFFLFFCYLFYTALVNSSIVTQQFKFAPNVLSFLAVMFFCSIVGISIWIFKYTVDVRIPRFKNRYSEVTVVSYNPNTTTRRLAKHELRQSRRFPINQEDLSLNGSNIEAGTEQARSCVEDMTIGQYMFGVCPSFQSSSTPIENSKDKSTFVFDACKNKQTETVEIV